VTSSASRAPREPEVAGVVGGKASLDGQFDDGAVFDVSDLDGERRGRGELVEKPFPLVGVLADLLPTDVGEFEP
jgi:hypothetical protein